MDENDIGTILLDVAFELHSELGPGLLESVYEIVLAHELRSRSLIVKRQIPVTISYKSLTFEEGFRADLIIEDKVIVEVKCVERLHNAHRKQLLTYLRLSNRPLGYFLNFSVTTLRDGMIRVVNGSNDFPMRDTADD